jgi:hypothetical protein
MADLIIAYLRYFSQGWMSYFQMKSVLKTPRFKPSRSPTPVNEQTLPGDRVCKTRNADEITALAVRA